MLVATVRVGYTVSRPVVPDERVSFVTVGVPLESLRGLAGAETEARLIAAQMVATRAGVQMPTSTRIIKIEI